MALDDSDLSDLSDTYDDVEEDELNGEDAVMQPSSEEDQPGDNDDDDDDDEDMSECSPAVCYADGLLNDASAACSRVRRRWFERR